MSTALGPRITATLAAINAELATGTVAYAVDKVPGTTGGPTGTLPTHYVTVEITRRWEQKKSAGGWVTVPAFALVTHYRAPNATTVNAIRDDVTRALENRAYDLPDGDTVGPFAFEFDGGLEFVAGGWSGFDSWVL